MPNSLNQPTDGGQSLDAARPEPSEARQAFDAASDNPAAILVQVEIFIGSGPNFLPALFGTSDVLPGSRVTLDYGSTITFQDAHELRSVDANTVIMLVLGIPTAVVSASTIASWLLPNRSMSLAEGRRGNWGPRAVQRTASAQMM
jgi:hypothetical protein